MNWSQIVTSSKGIKSSFESCSVFVGYQHVSFTPTAESLALAVDKCLYGRACPPSFLLRRGGRDVVPLSPAVREANLRNQVAPRDFPWGSTQIDVKKLHEHCVGAGSK